MWQSPPSNVKMAGCRTRKERCAATRSVGVSPTAYNQGNKKPPHPLCPQILKVPSYMHISCLE